MKGVKEFSSAMTEFEFIITVSCDNFLCWLAINIERYRGVVTQYYKNDRLTVTVEFK